MNEAIHSVVLVTAMFRHQELTAARKRAGMLGLVTSPVASSPLNGCETFMVLPSGSRAGWPQDSGHSQAVKEFVSWLETKRDAGGLRIFDWAAVEYGQLPGMNPVARVTRAPGVPLRARDIPTLPVLEFIRDHEVGMIFDSGDRALHLNVMRAMPPGTPYKVALAKMRGLISKGFITGCGCGCRGDFSLLQKGIDEIAKHEV